MMWKVTLEDITRNCATPIRKPSAIKLQIRYFNTRTSIKFWDIKQVCCIWQNKNKINCVLIENRLGCKNWELRKWCLSFLIEYQWWKKWHLKSFVNSSQQICKFKFKVKSSQIEVQRSLILAAVKKRVSWIHTVPYPENIRRKVHKKEKKSMSRCGCFK